MQSWNKPVGLASKGHNHHLLTAQAIRDIHTDTLNINTFATWTFLLFYSLLWEFSNISQSGENNRLNPPGPLIQFQHCQQRTSCFRLSPPIPGGFARGFKMNPHIVSCHPSISQWASMATICFVMTSRLFSYLTKRTMIP